MCPGCLARLLPEGKGGGGGGGGGQVPVAVHVGHKLWALTTLARTHVYIWSVVHYVVSSAVLYTFYFAQCQTAFHWLLAFFKSMIQNLCKLLTIRKWSHDLLT